MNVQRRKALSNIKASIESNKSALEDLRAEEEKYRDGMPENLQNGDNWQKADTACDELQEAIDSLESAMGNIDTATE